MKKKNHKTGVMILLSFMCAVCAVVGTVLVIMSGTGNYVEEYYARQNSLQQIGGPRPHEDSDSADNGVDSPGSSLEDPFSEGDGMTGSESDIVYELNPDVIEYDLTADNDYLLTFEENLDTETSYSMEWAFDTYQSGNGYVKWTVSYYQLKGDVQNLDVINEAIYNECTYLEQIFLENYDPNDPTLTVSYDAKEKCSVMYNDETRISILCEHSYTMYGAEQAAISDINIDLTTGEVLTNNEIFCPNAGFGARFREQCLLQNGSNDMLETLTDEQIIEYLMDDDLNVVFFTEKGLEVGFNYTSQLVDGSTQQGYVTITLNDYEKYLRNE